mmetsp:Transcript_58629/g.124315  ORF Transcript_58629/g.124315 Transcript_58629/m.124315 type:complete len:140 (+) Transcript_58629:132-551(+)
MHWCMGHLISRRPSQQCSLSALASQGRSKTCLHELHCILPSVLLLFISFVLSRISRCDLGFAGGTRTCCSIVVMFQVGYFLWPKLTKLLLGVGVAVTEGNFSKLLWSASGGHGPSADLGKGICKGSLWVLDQTVQQTVE